MKLRKFKIHKLQDTVELDRLVYLYALCKTEHMMQRHMAMKYKQGIIEYVKLHGSGNDRHKMIRTGQHVNLVYSKGTEESKNFMLAWNTLYRQALRDHNDALCNKMNEILRQSTTTRERERVNI